MRVVATALAVLGVGLAVHTTVAGQPSGALPIPFHAVAAAAIRDLGPKAKTAVPALRAALVARLDHVFPHHVATALWKVDRNTYMDLVQGKGNRAERHAAVLGLSHVGGAARELAPLVLGIAVDPADDDRERALSALSA